MLYVYGIVEQGRRAPAVAGVDGAAVALVKSSTLSIAVSEVPAAPEPTRERLAQHHRVTMALLAEGGVVPLRFGNAFDDEESLHRGLGPRAVELAGKLDQLAGFVELGLSLALADDPRRDPLQSGGEGTRYMLAKKRQLDTAEDLRARVGDIIQDWRAEVKGRTLRIACLIRAEHVEKLRNRLATFAPAPRVTGPWPPSSFV
jgi:hypothetical protein